MNSNAKNTVQVSHSFKHSAEKVFDAWLDSKNAGKWLFATPTGQMIKVEIHPQVGGSFNFTDLRDKEEVAHTGEYLELERPHRLAFTFAVKKYSQSVTRVYIDITPIQEGCELTLKHEGVDPEYIDRTKEGWSGILKKLDQLLT